MCSPGLHFSKHSWSWTCFPRDFDHSYFCLFAAVVAACKTSSHSVALASLAPRVICSLPQLPLRTWIEGMFQHMATILIFSMWSICLHSLPISLFILVFGKIVKLRFPCIMHKHLFCRSAEDLPLPHPSLALSVYSGFLLWLSLSLSSFSPCTGFKCLTWTHLSALSSLASEFACVLNVSCLVVGPLCSIVWFEFYCVTWYKLRNPSGYSGTCHWFQNLGGEGRRTAVNSRLMRVTQQDPSSVNMGLGRWLSWQSAYQKHEDCSLDPQKSH